MNWTVNGHHILLMLGVTFITSILLIPIIKKLANHVGAVDVPEKRKVHTKTTPRMGGLAIFLAFLTGYIFFGEISTQMISILIGSFLIILLGILDDIKSIRAIYKFMVQVLAASVIVLYGNICLQDIGAFGIYINFGIFAYPITIIFIAAIINAINFIDGLDGLAAGVSSIYFATIAIIAFMLNRIGNLDTTLSLLMLGATLGFLIFNFHPASIFMGDTGSMFLGFIIAVISLLGYKAATVTSLFVPILILFLPLLDTVLAIFRRIIKGKSIGTPDKEHIHHQLLRLNKSTKKTVFIMYGISLLCAAISIFYTLGDNKTAILLYIGLLIVITFLIFKTDILFKPKKKSRK
ncbi:MAG: MraY family glycosyltransferase [Bacilli bacterium]|nr:MraY family glycosyltransferase [Bacilli bacterium]